MAKDDRVRQWTFVCYPDSLPDGWMQILGNLHVPCYISPLHDLDINGDATEKKPHYHIILDFDGKKSYEQICLITSQLNATIPKRVESIRGLVRYLVHLDNPEKHQYDPSSIVCLSGADYSPYMEYKAVSRKKALREMREFIADNVITEFSDFCLYCDSNRPDWSDLLDESCSYVISLFITSIRHKLKGGLVYEEAD